MGLIAIVSGQDFCSKHSSREPELSGVEVLPPCRDRGPHSVIGETSVTPR
jgi:hypothetical protein